MIVLDALDMDRRSVSLRDIALSCARGEHDFERVSALVRRLGVHDLELRRDEDRPLPPNDGIKHRWIVYDDCMHYELTFPHRKESGNLVAMYSAIALATGGPVDDGVLMQLRLAIYELCLNVLEHGRRREEPGEVRLGLRFEDQAIRGWIEDRCEPFNPLDAKDSWGQRVAMRARRGYGIMIVRRLMDELSYEYTGHGNRISFCKKV